jgi:CheY-like chemotaxis protein
MKQENKKYKTIMIVEDDDAMRSTIKHLLEMQNYLIFESENAKEAIVKLDLLKPGNAPDMILTDINMPHNGIKFIEWLSKDKRYCHVPIVVMTANEISEISGKRVIPKPFELEAMLREIEALLR